MSFCSSSHFWSVSGAGISSARIPPSSSPFLRPGLIGTVGSRFGLSIKRRIFPAAIDLISLMRKVRNLAKQRISNRQIIFSVRVHIKQTRPGLASFSHATEEPEHHIGKGVFQVDRVAAMTNEGAEGIIRPSRAAFCCPHWTIPHRLQGSL